MVDLFISESYDEEKGGLLMKKLIFLMLLCLVLTGCGGETVAPTEGELQLANPWKSYDSIEEAEAACGLDFPLGNTVADSYQAESFRVMEGELMEVTYRDGDFEVTVRMQSEEGQDISGVYEEFKEINTFEEDGYTLINKPIDDGGMVQLVYQDGYSYSFYAPNHYWGDSNADFLAWLNE